MRLVFEYMHKVYLALMKIPLTQIDESLGSVVLNPLVVFDKLFRVVRVECQCRANLKEICLISISS